LFFETVKLFQKCGENYWSRGTKISWCSLHCIESSTNAFVGVVTFCLIMKLFCGPKKKKKKRAHSERPSVFHDSFIHWPGQWNFAGKQITHRVSRVPLLLYDGNGSQLYFQI
jgi:hypothetical protein